MKYIINTSKRAMMVIILLFMLFMPVEAQFRFNWGNKSPLNKLQQAEIAISNLYVDSVNENKLVEDAIQGMLEKLDPHSSYTTAKETESMSESLNGNFEGIGVQFNVIADTLVVIQPVLNGPSEKVGILAGDRIVSVEDTAIAGVKMSKEDMMRRLRGPKNTKVKLGVVRRGVKNVLYFTVTRDKIPLKTVDAVYMIRPQVGYIRLSSFGLTSPQEIADGLKTLKQQGMKSLILDLQQNGGGYLQSAAAIANEFLHEGDLVVYTKGRQVARQEYRADGKGSFVTGKLVVLIDEFSASAAEIVTGAIQDQDRGIVVGRRSFGKGLVQRPIPFDDGSMIRLTVAHYYTPSGRCIQKPYRKGDLKDYEMDFENRYNHGELIHKDSIHLDSTLVYHTLRKHRLVYGGGGIMPDEFVPLDTTRYTHLFRQLSIKGIIVNEDLKYIDNHRKDLKKQYTSFENFNKEYEVPQKLIDTILSEGKKQKIQAKDDAELKKTLPSLKIQIKALVARDLFDMNEYFQIINETDDIIQRALEVIKK
jgi:carboxyl-terminal processing protease